MYWFLYDNGLRHERVKLKMNRKCVCHALRQVSNEAFFSGDKNQNMSQG